MAFHSMQAKKRAAYAPRRFPSAQPRSAFKRFDSTVRHGVVSDHAFSSGLLKVDF
jgi:hypothetical protein